VRDNPKSHKYETDKRPIVRHIENVGPRKFFINCDNFRCRLSSIQATQIWKNLEVGKLSTQLNTDLHDVLTSD